MSLKEASFQVHHLAQNFFPCPYFVDIKQDALVPHPTYNRIYHRIFRTFISYGITVGQPIVSLYLLWLFVKSKSKLQTEYINHFIVYSLISAMLVVFHYCNYLMLTTSQEREYLLTQACKIYRQEKLSNKSIRLGRFTLQELFIYIFSGAFLFIILIVFVAPFTFSLDPIQLALGDSLPVKIICSILYGFGSGHLLWYLLSSFLVTIAALEMAVCYSRELVVKVSHQNINEHIPSTKFYKCYNRYVQTRLLFDLSSIVAKQFPAIIAIIGTLLCSVTTTGTLTMWGKLNVFTYLILPIGSTVCFSIAMVFTSEAGAPYKNVLHFQKFWKRFLLKKLDRRMLKAARHFGFDVGPYGICTPKLGPLLCQDIIANTADLLLIM